MSDVIVLGAGLSGCITATKLAIKGYKVTVIESNGATVFHLPETSFISAKTITDILDIDGGGEQLKNCFTSSMSAEFKAKDGATSVSLSYRSHSPKKINTVDRFSLRNALINIAKSKGVTFQFNEKIIEVDFHKKGVSVKSVYENCEKHYAAKLVIDATGKCSFISEILNLRKSVKTIDKRDTIFTHYDIEQSNSDLNSNIIISETVGGYVFCVPIGQNRVSVGLVERETKDKVIDEERFNAAVSDVSWLREIIRLSDRKLPYISVKNTTFHVDECCSDSYIIVGEALGFQDPFYSDGIRFSLESAVLAYELAIKQLDSSSDHQDLTLYKQKISQLRDACNESMESNCVNASVIQSNLCFADPHIPYGISAFLSLASGCCLSGGNLKMRNLRNQYAI